MFGSSATVVACGGVTVTNDYLPSDKNISYIEFSLRLEATQKEVLEDLENAVEIFSTRLRVKDLFIQIVRNEQFVSFDENYIVQENDEIVVMAKKEADPYKGVLRRTAEELREDLKDLRQSLFLTTSNIHFSTTYKDIYNDMNTRISGNLKEEGFKITINDKEVTQENENTLIGNEAIIRIDAPENSKKYKGYKEIKHKFEKMDSDFQPPSFKDMGGNSKQDFENWLSATVNQRASSFYFGQINLVQGIDWVIKGLEEYKDPENIIVNWDEVETIPDMAFISVDFKGETLQSNETIFVIIEQ